ncbi:MAG: hypothetical protein WDN27_01785 [Candidatus Saccharibacteria bacterium]
MYPDTRVRTISRLLLAGIVLAILGIAFGVVYSLHSVQGTGVLKVSSSEAQATISISAVNMNAATIGTGSATVRVSPGTYLVVAKGRGDIAYSVAHVQSGATTRLSLKPSSASLLPSLQTTFSGTEALTAMGMDSGILTNIEQQLVLFAPTTTTFSVNTATATIGHYDPNAANPQAPYVFDITIGSKTYHATVLPSSDGNTATLTLIDAQTGATAYTTSS